MGMRVLARTSTNDSALVLRRMVVVLCHFVERWPKGPCDKIAPRCQGLQSPGEHSEMPDNVNGEQELALLIVESLNLEGVAPEDIEPEAALFGEGLGLDSLDMLELSMAVEKKYGVRLRSDDPENEKIFASLRSLRAHIDLHRAG